MRSSRFLELSREPQWTSPTCVAKCRRDSRAGRVHRRSRLSPNLRVLVTRLFSLRAAGIQPLTLRVNA